MKKFFRGICWVLVAGALHAADFVPEVSNLGPEAAHEMASHDVFKGIDSGDRLMCSPQQAVLTLPDAIALYASFDEPSEVVDKAPLSCSGDDFEHDFIGVYGETFYDRDSSVMRESSAIVTRNVCFDAQKVLEIAASSENGILKNPLMCVKEGEIESFMQGLRAAEGAGDSTHA